MRSIERTVAKEAGLLLRRDFWKHKGVVAGLYIASLIDPRAAKVARPAYIFMRHIDDVLDGDRKISGQNPLEYIEHFKKQIESGEFDPNSEISQLARTTLDRLNHLASESDNPRQDMIGGMEWMKFDYERAQERRVLKEDELAKYFAQSLASYLNILLLGVGSDYRVSDFPGLPEAFCKSYTLRDFHLDWRGGMINIPAETLDRAGLDSSADFREVARNKIVRRKLRDYAFDSVTTLQYMQVDFKVYSLLI